LKYIRKKRLQGRDLWSKGRDLWSKGKDLWSLGGEIYGSGERFMVGYPQASR
jgi:hypothetical protein